MWYYVHDGESRGPFDEPSFNELVARGVITADSQIWNETMSGWTSLQQARPVLSIPVAVNSSGGLTVNASCDMCHANVGADNLINLSGVRVCAACKPLAVQRMREGVGLVGENTAWRDGKKLIIQDKTHLPARCVKCNAETSEPPLKRKLAWHHPAYYLLILLSVFIYVIVALCIRKRATVEMHLCRRHLDKRRRFIIGACAAGAVSLILMGVSLITNISWLFVAGEILLPAAFIIGIFGATAMLLRTSRIRGKTVWLAGANPAFLDSLPQWPG